MVTLKAPPPPHMLSVKFVPKKAPLLDFKLSHKKPPPPMLSVKFVLKNAPMLCVKFSPKKAPHVKR